jgi:hypothetical protein
MILPVKFYFLRHCHADVLFGNIGNKKPARDVPSNSSAMQNLLLQMLLSTSPILLHRKEATAAFEIAKKK